MVLTHLLALLLAVTPVPVEPPLEAPQDIISERAPDQGELDDDRKAPDYDGRQPDYSPGGGVWIPRVVLFPFYAFNQYLLRAPIGGAVRFLDEKNVVTRLKSALTFRHGTIGFFPAFAVANGQRPGFGLSGYANDLFVDWHSVTLTATTDFAHNVMAVMINSFHLSRNVSLNLRTSVEKRNDLVFYGVGRDTHESDQRRFSRDRPVAALELVIGSAARASGQAAQNGPSSSLGANNSNLGADQNSGVAGQQPDTGHFGMRLGVEVSSVALDCSERSIDICGPDHRKGTADDTYTMGKHGEAAYLYSGYSMARFKLLVSADSRPATRPEATGVRLDMFGRYGKGMGDRAHDVDFVRYGAELSGFLDVSGGHRRVLAASLYVEMLDTINHGEVPFPELIALGGPEGMRGFLRARFQGRSATVGTLEYRWPIWTLLDASLFYEMGNAFDTHLKDFAIDYLFGSYGLAFRSNFSRDVSAQLLFAIGTERWSIAPERFQFAIATNVGF